MTSASFSALVRSLVLACPSRLLTEAVAFDAIFLHGLHDVSTLRFCLFAVSGGVSLHFIQELS